MDTVLGRIPEDIVTARCDTECRDCLLFFNGLRRCEEIYYNVPVYVAKPETATDSDGWVKMKQNGFVRVVVGCSCVAQAIQHVNIL